jgi:predicted ATPase
LQARGFEVIPEVARSIISERIAKGLSPRPPPDQFARTIMDRDIRQYESAPPGPEPVFFDRSLLDSLGMLAQVGELPEAEKEALLTRYPYHPVAFILPPWSEIYRTDAERDQTFEESIEVYRSLRDWYAQCGYDLVEVPRTSVEERSAFVLKSLNILH